MSLFCAHSPSPPAPARRCASSLSLFVSYLARPALARDADAAEPVVDGAQEEGLLHKVEADDGGQRKRAGQAGRGLRGRVAGWGGGGGGGLVFRGGLDGERGDWKGERREEGEDKGEGGSGGAGDGPTRLEESRDGGRVLRLGLRSPPARPVLGGCIAWTNRPGGGRGVVCGVLGVGGAQKRAPPSFPFRSGANRLSLSQFRRRRHASPPLSLNPHLPAGQHAARGGRGSPARGQRARAGQNGKAPRPRPSAVRPGAAPRGAGPLLCRLLSGRTKAGGVGVGVCLVLRPTRR